MRDRKLSNYIFFFALWPCRSSSCLRRIKKIWAPRVHTTECQGEIRPYFVQETLLREPAREEITCAQDSSNGSQKALSIPSTVNLAPRCITNCTVLPNAHLSTIGRSCLAHKLMVKLAVVPNDDGRKQGVEVCIRNMEQSASSSLPRSFDAASSTKVPAKNRTPTPWFHIPRQTQLVRIDHNAVCWAVADK